MLHFTFRIILMLIKLLPFWVILKRSKEVIILSLSLLLLYFLVGNPFLFLLTLILIELFYLLFYSWFFLIFVVCIFMWSWIGFIAMWWGTGVQFTKVGMTWDLIWREPPRGLGEVIPTLNFKLFISRVISL